MYLKDSNGEKSLSATVAMITFAVVLLKVLMNNSMIQLADFSYSFGTISSDEIAALLGTTLGTYAIRRHTDRKFTARGGSGSVEP